MLPKLVCENLCSLVGFWHSETPMETVQTFAYEYIFIAVTSFWTAPQRKRTQACSMSQRLHVITHNYDKLEIRWLM